MARLVKTLSSFVDDIADDEPDRLFAWIPDLASTECWKRMTYNDLAAASNAMAWWLDEVLGTATRTFMYMGYVCASSKPHGKGQR
jgi:acyl-coenzyme A synthetase/AMP-(fatty) acid ligase